MTGSGGGSSTTGGGTGGLARQPHNAKDIIRNMTNRKYKALDTITFWLFSVKLFHPKLISEALKNHRWDNIFDHAAQTDGFFEDGRA